jgi:hypothetical protein
LILQLHKGHSREPLSQLPEWPWCIQSSKGSWIRTVYVRRLALNIYLFYFFYLIWFNKFASSVLILQMHGGNPREPLYSFQNCLDTSSHRRTLNSHRQCLPSSSESLLMRFPLSNSINLLPQSWYFSCMEAIQESSLHSFQNDLDASSHRRTLNSHCEFTILPSVSTHAIFHVPNSSSTIILSLFHHETARSIMQAM